MSFEDELRQRFPNLPSDGQTLPPENGAIPVGVKQFSDGINNFMPMIEQVTGLTRREISLQLLKTGFKGGGIDSILSGLMGQKPAPEAKFIKYVKTLALWVPVFIGLCGGVIIGLLLFTKMALAIIGAP